MKKQVFRFSNSSTYNNKNYTDRLYVTFTYSGEDHNLSLDISQTGMAKVYGNDTIDINSDTWYKVEGRLHINEDDKLCLGIYYNDALVSYYVQTASTNSVNYSNNLSMYQNDFCGETTKVSPELTHYDDIHYGLYPASYIPSATEVELSEANDVATAKIYGNSIKSANLIVALYDNMDRLAGIKSSDVISVDVDKVTGSRTITCDFSTVGSYDSYKLFLFDSLTSLKPLTEVEPSK
ncbi:MAG: hypothetical protein UH854_05570 [Clostridia bacterium]|nr:hypothetical protein [Clostridia bacterium]